MNPSRHFGRTPW